MLENTILFFTGALIAFFINQFYLKYIKKCATTLAEQSSEHAKVITTAFQSISLVNLENLKSIEENLVYHIDDAHRELKVQMLHLEAVILGKEKAPKEIKKITRSEAQKKAASERRRLWWAEKRAKESMQQLDQVPPNV